MTGPPYPPLPGYGSNAIGRFAIGVSQIGDIAPFNVWTTVISQYANSPRITAMILDWDACLDQTENFSDFYDLIMNVATAQGYGLDVWGRIVGVVRTVKINVGQWFGFAEALPSSLGFNQGAFFSGTNVTDNYVLSDTAFRQLIYAKALTNISDGSIPSINKILMTLFPHRGNAYVEEGNQLPPFFGFQEALPSSVGFGQGPFYSGSLGNAGMNMAYVFTFTLQPFELAIVQTPGVLPKPTGVLASIIVPPS